MTEAAEVDSVARYASARIDAVRDADANALDRLLHGDPVYIHASGRREDKSGYIESLASGNVVYGGFEASDVRFLADDDRTTIRTGQMKFEAFAKGELKPLDVRFTEVWMREGRDWRLILRQSTPLLSSNAPTIATPDASK
jgi:ketosteroid isomerase-like protein